jgi:acetyl esterase/lipase
MPSITESPQAATFTAVVLEPAAQAFADATAKPPFLYDLSPAEGRKAVDQTQSGDIFKPAVDDEWIKVDEVDVRIVRPAGAAGVLPVILSIHGAGWVFGDAHSSTPRAW